MFSYIERYPMQKAKKGYISELSTSERLNSVAILMSTAILRSQKNAGKNEAFPLDLNEKRSVHGRSNSGE